MHYRKSGCAINKREWVGIKCTQVDSLRNKRLVKPDFLSCFCLFSISHTISISMSSAIKWRLVPIYLSRRSTQCKYIFRGSYTVQVYVVYILLRSQSSPLQVCRAICPEESTASKWLSMVLLFSALSQLLLMVQYCAEIKLRMVLPCSLCRRSVSLVYGRLLTAATMS